MDNQTIFHLARHGQTYWNLEHRIQGQLDSGLTALGQQQALQLAKGCSTLNLSMILTSPLGRSVETANICANYLQIKMLKLKGVEERNFGLWQGKLTPEMKSHKNYLEITSRVTDIAPEEGESAKQLLTRFETALVKQFESAPDEQYLIITHGDALRCFYQQFLNKEGSSTGYDYANCQLLTFNYDHLSKRFSTS